MRVGLPGVRAPLVARRRIWCSGAVAIAAIAAFATLGAHPLTTGERDNHQTVGTLRLLEQVNVLRTALGSWQIFIGPHFADLAATPAKPDPSELAKGAILAQAQSNDALALIASLDAEGLSANARGIKHANTVYTASITKFAPLDNGASQAVIAATVAAETTAFNEMMTETATAETLLRTRADDGLQASSDRLDSSRITFLAANGVVAALALLGAIAFGQRARSRERADRTRAERQAFDATMHDALEMAKTETEAYNVMRQALRETVPALQVEMLVADSSRAHFHQMLDTRAEGDTAARSGCGVVSPADCPATRRSRALFFPTSRALNACPYLKDRASGDLSAACIPINVTGRASAVVHATGPDGTAPARSDTYYLEATSRLAAERIAILRAFEKSEAQARTDPLTGLWNRRSFENRIHELRRDGTEYTFAYGDLDHFKVLNDTHGHEAGDQALRLFARVLRDAIRPADITARYGGEEFVIVLPDCPVETAIRILERLRERLALTLTTGRVPPFTVSFGVASSADADTFDEVVALADQALLTAKKSGRNRTIRAVTVDEPTRIRAL